MADYAEEIAKRIAERKSRRRYWPEGEPGSRHERDRDHGKRRAKSDPGEKKWSLDSEFKPKSKAEPEKLESISEFVKKERTRRLERALKTMEERRAVPKDVPLKKWLSDPENLKRAQKRGMVKKIAKRANPKSKDTDDVVTVGGSRYAKTDLYKAPIRERASEIVLKTKYGSEMWWDRNKKVVFVAAVSLVAGFMAYTVWKNKQLQQDVARRRVRSRALAARPSAQHAGLLAVPSHHWHRHRPRYFSGPPFPWNHWGHHHGYMPWGRNPWHWRAGAHGGAGGAGHGGGGGTAHGGGGIAHGGGGGALGHGGMMQGHGGDAFHGAHHGFGHEGWGGLGGWGGWGGGGWGGWGDWNLGYPDDASLWGDPYDAFDPYASWW